MYWFDVSDPAELFKGFSIEPEIWATIDIAQCIGSYGPDYPSAFVTGGIRYRPATKPLEGSGGTVGFFD